MCLAQIIHISSHMICLFRGIFLGTSRSLLCFKWSCGDKRCHCILCLGTVPHLWFQVTSCRKQIHQALRGFHIWCVLSRYVLWTVLCLTLFVVPLPGPGAAESTPSQPGGERLCKSLPQLHLWVHFQQLSWAVQSGVPDRSCELLISRQKFSDFLR